MTRAEIVECSSLLKNAVYRLLGSPTEAVNATELRFLSGQLISDLVPRFMAWDFVDDLSELFDVAVRAGARVTPLRMVIAELPAITTEAGAVLGRLLVRLSLVSIAKVLISGKFENRNEIEEIVQSLNSLFDDAEEAAADNSEPAVYRSLSRLRSTVIRDLTTRGRSLPRVVEYDLKISLPVMTIANRFYADANRSDEVAKENEVYHPLFAPRNVRGLSA